MNHSIYRRLAVALLCCLALGCTARFSPKKVRSEIVRQRGVEPKVAFEFQLGRLTTYLLRGVLNIDVGDSPFQGLRELQLSVYETPEQDGPAIDVTRFGVRGWEPLIRSRDSRRSILILARAKGSGSWAGSDAPLGDLVVIGAGKRKVVYGRLQGTLSPELASDFRRMFEDGGPDELQDALSGLSSLGDGGS